MKSTLISILILFAILTANAQDKPLTFSNFVRADSSATKKDLYQHGKVWFSETFEGAGKEIQVEDPGQGIIFGKAYFQYDPNVVTWSAKTKGKISYTIKLNFNDGRYKYELSNFVHEGSGISFDQLTEGESCKKEIPDATAEWTEKVCNDMKLQAQIKADRIIKSLISSMNKTK